LIQAAGGGIAATAETNDVANTGAYIMARLLCLLSLCQASTYLTCPISSNTPGGGRHVPDGESHLSLRSFRETPADVSFPCQPPRQVIMLIFTATLIEFAYRYKTDKPVKQLRSLHPWASCIRRRRERKARKAGATDGISDAMPDETTAADGPGIHSPQGERNVRLMLIGLCISTFFIFVRSVYRCVPLA
jgi:hypothetical protein